MDHKKAQYLIHEIRERTSRLPAYGWEYWKSRILLRAKTRKDVTALMSLTKTGLHWYKKIESEELKSHLLETIDRAESTIQIRLKWAQ